MITIVMVGKHKEYPQFEDYAKKCEKLSLLDVKEEKANNPEIVMKKEGKRLLEKAKGFTVALSEDGVPLTSQMLAELLARNPQITFLVGGAFGIAQEVKDESNLIFSLSRLTFPHELAHLVLIEQIYRAQKINEGHPYHK